MITEVLLAMRCCAQIDWLMILTRVITLNSLEFHHLIVLLLKAKERLLPLSVKVSRLLFFYLLSTPTEFILALNAKLRY